MDEQKILEDCYRNSLSIAKQLGLRSVAFPSIGTGAYGYPISEACRTALAAVKNFVEKEGWPQEVVFVLFSPDDLDTYRHAVRELH